MLAALRNIPDRQTDTNTHKIPASKAPVGAKNTLSCYKIKEAVHSNAVQALAGGTPTGRC